MPQPELTPAQRDIIRALPSRFPPGQIDRLWVFPPHFGKSHESGLLVLSLLPEGEDGPDPHRRALVTVRYEASQAKKGLRLEERTTEEGMAPCDGIERVIAGVVSRSNPDGPEPIAVAIEGRQERWDQLLERLGLAA